MLMDFFRALGLEHRLALHVNSIGDAGDRPAYVARLVDYLTPSRSELCARNARRASAAILCASSIARCRNASR